MNGYFLVRCDSCRRLWMAQPRMADRYGRCGAQGPSSYTCNGWLIRADDSDNTGRALATALIMGGWEAMVAVLDDHPYYGWVKNQGYSSIPDIHMPKCRRCGEDYESPRHNPGGEIGKDPLMYLHWHPFELEVP